MTYAIHPTETELREARALVEGAVAACDAVVDKQDAVVVSLSWTADPLVVAGTGVGARALATDELLVEFNATVDGWTDALPTAVAEAYGAACFYEGVPTDSVFFAWQDVLRVGYARAIARRALGDAVPTSNVDPAAHWSAVRAVLVEEPDPDDPFGDLDLPDGYVDALADAIVDALTERNDLSALPTLNRSVVLEAGDDAFT